MTRIPEEVPPGLKIIRFLAEGASGEVYLARQLSIDREIALKILPESSRMSMTGIERFLREARVAGRLDNRHIVGAIDAGFVSGRPYLTMEYCPGGTLKDRIGRDFSQGVRDNAAVAATVDALVVVAHALAALHGVGVIHRDLKPSNILYGNDGSPRISDFGIACLVDDETITASGEILGTLPYMAPELLDHTRHSPPSARTDVYALGVILYEMLTGVLPFSGQGIQLIREIVSGRPTPPRSLRPHIPSEVESICLKALNADPADRYATAIDLARDLECFRDRRPIRARPQTLTYHARKWLARNPRLAAGGVLILVGLVAGLGAAWNSERAGRAEASRLRTLAYNRFAERRYAEAVALTMEASEIVRSKPWTSAEELTTFGLDLQKFREAADAEEKWLRFTDSRQRAIARGSTAGRFDPVEQVRTCNDALSIYQAFAPDWEREPAVLQLVDERQALLRSQVDELLGENDDLAKAHSLRVLSFGGTRAYLIHGQRRLPGIAELPADSPLAKLGVQPGDLLLRVDGRPSFLLTEEQRSQLSADYRQVGKQFEFASPGKLIRVDTEQTPPIPHAIKWRSIRPFQVAGLDSPFSSPDLRVGDILLRIGNDLSRHFDPMAHPTMHETSALQIRLSRQAAGPIPVWIQREDGDDLPCALNWTEQDREMAYNREVERISRLIRMEFGGILSSARSSKEKNRQTYAITDPRANHADLVRQSFNGEYGWPVELIDAAFTRTRLSEFPVLMQAMEAAASKNQEEALGLLHRHLQANPSDSDARLVQIACCLELQRSGELITASTEYLRLRPREPVARFFRAMAYVELGETEAAIRDLEYIVETRPDYSHAPTLLQQLRETQAKKEAAEK